MAELTIRQAFEIAFRQHRAGKLADAEALYRQILAHQPRHTGTMQMLAQLAQGRGASGEAEELLRRAIAIDPNDADAQNNLGMVLATQRRFEQAVPAFGQALLLRPDFPEAYNNLGNALRAHGNIADSIRAYEKALRLRPDYAEARENLSGVLEEKAQRAQAAARRPQVAPPSAPVAPSAPAAPAQPSMLESEEPEPRIPGIREAAADTELLGEHFEEQTGAEDEISDLPAAGDERTFVVEAEAPTFDEQRIEPVTAQAPVNGAAELAPSLSMEPEAEPPPEHASERARTHESESEPEQAHASMLEPGEEIKVPTAAEDVSAPIVEALEVSGPVPQTAEDFRHRGLSRWEQGQYDQALADLHAAMDLNPADAATLTDLGLLLLAQGDFRKGWPAYEARLAEAAPLQALDPAQWDGADLANHRILLRAEQGASDAIQFIRYAPLVHERGGRVIVRCTPELKDLLSDQPGILLVVSTADPMPKFYTHVGLASLPRVFGTTPSTVPADVPYLLPDGRLADKWNERMSREPAGLKVGLALDAGSAGTFPPSAAAAPPASILEALAQVSGARFYNLQLAAAADEPAAPAGLDLIDWTVELQGIAGAAALISNLDLVITADNAIAHLAGALGRPAWLLLPFVCDWRWMIEGAASPWYPTVRLFRQPSANDWEEPVRRLIEELRSQLPPR